MPLAQRNIPFDDFNLRLHILALLSCDFSNPNYYYSCLFDSYLLCPGRTEKFARSQLQDTAWQLRLKVPHLRSTCFILVHLIHILAPIILPLMATQPGENQQLWFVQPIPFFQNSIPYFFPPRTGTKRLPGS